MRISQLNLSLMHCNHNKNNSFKGLWGETSVMKDKDPALCIMSEQQTYYYYPFFDETQDEIDLAVEQNTNAYIDDYAPEPIYVLKECKVCTRLPFTKAAFSNYIRTKNTENIEPEYRKIHTNVVGKYLNNNLGAQISAQNTAIADNFNLYA